MKTSLEKWRSNILMSTWAVALAFLFSCAGDDGGSSDDDTTDETTTEETTDEDDDDAMGNNDPTATAIDDQDFPEGYVATVDLTDFFSDSDNDALTFTVTSSNTAVATVAVDASSLSVTGVSIGTSNISITADDGNEGSASATFAYKVSSCTNDDALNSTRTTCDKTGIATSFSVNIEGDLRTITTNGQPDHMWGNQIPMLVSELDDTSEDWSIDLTPSLASSTTPVVDDDGSPNYAFGIALNGVAMDPAPGTPFIFENSETGEYNWDWVFEPNNNMTAVGLDCATAHVQPDGTYHYHGDMIEFAEESLLTGISTGTVPTTLTEAHVGWAADGFPVFYRYGPDGADGYELLDPSYRLREGFRGGDGISEPCGEFNGKYTKDYEYVDGLGDLDECNGIERSVDIGGRTYTYFYMITEDFPVMSRCLSGTPSEDFAKGGSMGPP